ncbi:MAG: hypothetical protein M3357_05230, partial [Actinomycetota bacterium]|nr:hypothetical protein [Actinomycetota bacterium]
PAPALMARGLPALEAALAVALLAFPDHPAPASAALATVAVFTVAVAWRLARGRAVPCPCFGAREGRPVSGTTLVRNGLLLGLAALALPPAGGAAPAPAAVAVAITAPLTAIALRRTS